MSRILVLLVLTSGCRSAPAWEPISGFELVERSEVSGWSELTPAGFQLLLANARGAVTALEDYAATLETRERIEHELFPRRELLVKIRQQPFSVAAETLQPESEAGQRIWFDETWNGAKLMAETPGFLGRLIGKTSHHPLSGLAMKHRRHPITDIGLLRLIEQIDEQLGPALARTPPPRLRIGASSIGARPVQVVEILVPGEEYPQPALVYHCGFDDESKLMTYYGQAQLLPDGPALLEEYLYSELRTNIGLEDSDFRPPK
jgi:hypothetical protein